MGPVGGGRLARMVFRPLAKAGDVAAMSTKVPPGTLRTASLMRELAATLIVPRIPPSDWPSQKTFEASTAIPRGIVVFVASSTATGFGAAVGGKVGGGGRASARMRPLLSMMSCLNVSRVRNRLPL